MDGLYELKEMLCKELEEYGKKGELTAGSLEIVDKLAHAVKNLCKIIEAAEEEEEMGYSERGGSYRGSYARGGNQGGGGQGGGRGGRSSNRGGSYASPGRGRGSNARRDSMGRYSSDGGYSRQGGYSMDGGKEEMIMQLEDLKQDAPSQKIMQRIDDLISELERD